MAAKHHPFVIGRENQFLEMFLTNSFIFQNTRNITSQRLVFVENHIKIMHSWHQNSLSLTK